MKILAVDDEELNLELIEQFLKEEGYETIPASNGLEGLRRLQENKDVVSILLDRTMPQMNGMEFIKKIKECNEFENIPIIMQTAVADNNSVVEGINAGVYYYLTKPYRKNVLISIVNAAINDFRYKRDIVEEMNKSKKVLGLLHNTCFELHTMDEAQNLAFFLSGSFPDPDRVVFGLSEIMLNAVEHGNLGISYNEKKELLRNGNFLEEIARREAMPENKMKKVRVFFEKNENEITVTVKDEGKGFDWTEFIEMNPARATDPNGRGIVKARIFSFDNMEYKGNGNEVCCTVRI